MIMTQEEKELLLKDLCARLSYGVKCTTKSTCWNGIYEIIGYKDERIYLDCPQYDEGDDEWLIENIKPYLRPKSSMSKEEKKFLNNILEYQYCSDDSCMCEASDYLNSIHVDYRGLIPMGLALPAPEGMYKID